MEALVKYENGLWRPVIQMVENPNDSADKLKRKHAEVYAEIREIMNGRVSIDALKEKGTLSPKLRRLIALGSAIATQRGREMVESCVADCLKAGANREQIMEVLRLTIVMAEVPVETYDTMVCEAIDSFERQD